MFDCVCAGDVTAKSPNLWHRWGQTSLPNKLMILATITIAVSNAIFVIYARRQWSVMSGQLTEMRGSAAQTDKLIERQLSRRKRPIGLHITY
jgi:hypothetical protein